MSSNIKQLHSAREQTIESGKKVKHVIQDLMTIMK
jgi:hypothetical protein